MSDAVPNDQPWLRHIVQPAATQAVPQEPAPSPRTTGGAVLSLPSDGGGLGLPPEADTLYGRVRKAEGTAQGDGFVIYGGKPFTPGKEHPGAAARVSGPQGPTSAAGPGQWEEATWNGLKPEFEKRFGHAPDFSSDADQKAMTWINAGKSYPGGESAMQRDIAAGKLDTSKLASQWSGFGQPWNEHVVAKGNWNVSPKAIEFEQGRHNTSVLWMAPDDYLQMTPELAAGKTKSRSLAKSLALGEDIEAIPTLDVKREGDNYKVTDQDGRRRAIAAKEAGVDLIPVAVHGAEGEAKNIVGMTGKEHAFDFKPVPMVKREQDATAKFMEGVGTGARTALGGAAQLASHLVPESVEKGVNRFNNWLADEGVPLARVPEGGVDQLERERLQQLQAERGPTATIPEMVGEAAATIPLAALGPGGNASMLARLAGMAGMGAAGGAMSPVASGDFWTEKAKQAGEGAAVGAGLGVGGNMLARMAAPVIRPAAQRLMDAGVRLTPGMLRGSFLKGAEDRLSSVVPTMTGAVRRSIEDFNRAAYDKVLSRIGKAYEGKKVGYDGIEAVEKDLAREYDRILPHVKFKADREFVADLKNLTELTTELPADDARRFKAILRNRVMKRMGPEGAMDGKTFKLVESDLSKISRDLHRSELSGDRQLGTAIDEVNGMLREGLERQNPGVASQLRDVNGAWAAFVRIRDASANRVKSLGVFTPSDLLIASKRAAGKRVFARGDALMQDLARDAQEVIPNTYPESGTAGRLMAAHLAFGGGGLAAMFNHPEVLATMGLGTAAYTRGGEALLRGAAGAGLPQVRNFLARSIRSGIPPIVPGAAMSYTLAQPNRQP